MGGDITMEELKKPGLVPSPQPQTELQKAISAATDIRMTRPSDLQWEGLQEMDWRKNKPWMVARILTEAPWNLTPAMALAVTLTAMEEGANPFMSDLYVIEGKITFSVQFKLKKARQMGMQLGVPKYEMVEREWPINKVIYTTKDAKKNKQGIKLDKDRGCQCELPVGDDVIIQTAWLSTSHRPSTTWNDDPDHMLKVRAIDYCLRFLGVGISEPIEAEEQVKEAQGTISVKK